MPIEVELGEAVVASCGRRQNFNDQIRCTLAAVFIHLAFVAYHRYIRLNHRAHILGRVGRYHAAQLFNSAVKVGVLEDCVIDLTLDDHKRTSLEKLGDIYSVKAPKE